MIVKQIEVKAEQRPRREKPVSDALQTLDSPGRVTVRIQAENGAEGSAECFYGRMKGGPEALAALVEHVLKPVVMGTELVLVKQTYQAMLREVEYHNAVGITMFGISLLDTALWDCLGRSIGRPCWQLWGGQSRRVPAYAMVGWLNFSDEEVKEICAQAVKQGFHGVKIKVGYPTLKEDIRRIETVRSAIGESTDLMVDANQSLTVKEAIRRGRAFQEMGIRWWEEPIPAADIDGYAELASRLDIPIATGENLYTPADFARFLARGAVDIVQPDLRRAGGPTSLLQIGMLAHSFGRPYASHGGGPVQLNVMAALPNALYLETGLIPPDSPLKLIDGCAVVPEGPGFSWG